MFSIIWDSILLVYSAKALIFAFCNSCSVLNFSYIHLQLLQFDSVFLSNKVSLTLHSGHSIIAGRLLQSNRSSSFSFIIKCFLFPIIFNSKIWSFLQEITPLLFCKCLRGLSHFGQSA